MATPYATGTTPKSFSLLPFIEKAAGISGAGRLAIASALSSTPR
jgi:hypothetical protein